MNLYIFITCWVVIFFQPTFAADGDWGDPVFVDMGQEGIKVSYNDNRCLIQVDEELSPGERMVKIDYKGSEMLTFDIDDNIYGMDLDTNNRNIIISKSPDFDLKYYAIDIIKIYAGAEEKKCLVQLMNIDDNVPQVTIQTPSNCSIQENNKIGEEIKTCSFNITDADGCAYATVFDISVQGGSAGTFSMKFSKREDYPGCLNTVIREKTALVQLQVDSQLDYDSAFNYFLTINYKDSVHGGLPLAQVVQVTDESDLPPAWEKVQSTLTVNEEEEKTITVKASDQDRQINNEICYYADVLNENLSDEEKDYFTMDEKTGALTIGKINRDRFQVNIYTLNLTALECVNTTSSVDYFLVVQVKDSINKNLTYDIEGLTEYPEQKFNENTIPTLKFKINVTDPDEGDYGTFDATINNNNFSIIPSRAYKNGIFLIQGKSSYDYEDPTQRDFQILVAITEVADKSHKVEIPIHIIIEDVNDEAPVIQDVDDKEQIIFKTDETLDKCTIGTVKTIDADQGSVVKRMAGHGALMSEE